MHVMCAFVIVGDVLFDHCDVSFLPIPPHLARGTTSSASVDHDRMVSAEMNTLLSIGLPM